jgi:hypothetical protein
MNQNGPTNPERRSSPLLIGVVIFLALAGAASPFLFTKPWMGIRQSGEQVTRVGTYRSPDACRRDVEKTGGWCGKGCGAYGEGSIADCNPLLTIPRKVSN